MILKLSNLLRTSLDRTNSDLAPFEDELKFVGDYLDLEKMRFGIRLRTEWRIAPETRRMLVPQMILQPLVKMRFNTAFRPREKQDGSKLRRTKGMAN